MAFRRALTSVEAGIALCALLCCSQLCNASGFAAGRQLKQDVNPYPSIAEVNCTLDSIKFDFDVIKAFTSGLAVIPASRLTENGVSTVCQVLTTLDSPLLSCLGDLGDMEGCCSEGCYSALQEVYADTNPAKSVCVPQLLRAVCLINNTASAATRVALDPLALALFSITRRCVTGLETTCKTILAPPASASPPSPAAIAPSPSPPSPSAAPTEPAGCTDMKDLLDTVNVVRALHYSLPLTWNDTLAATAQNRTQELLAQYKDTCSLPTGATLQPGENVFVFPLSNASCDAAAGWWLAGEAYYNYTATPWDTNAANVSMWRQFAQMVWANSSQVGCASANTSSSATGCQAVSCFFLDVAPQPPTNQALLDNVMPFIDPSGLNQTVANSSVCSGMDQLPLYMNLLRMGHATRPLYWNTSLVTAAKARATEVAQSSPSCSFPSSNITLMFGESLYLGPWQSYSVPGMPTFDPPCAMAVAAFMNGTGYNPNNPSYKTIDYWGSYTQMLWFSSQQVGCEAALHTLPEEPGALSVPGFSSQCLAVVCKYDPPGNTPLLDSVFTYNVRRGLFNATEYTQGNQSISIRGMIR